MSIAPAATATRNQTVGVLVALTLARLAFGYQLQTVASLTPELAAHFHLSFTAIGTLVGLYMLPGIVAALSCGFLAQRVGDRAVLGAGMLLMTLGSVAAGLADGPTGIGAARLLGGAGAVALTVLQGKAVADLFRGRAFMLALSVIVGAFPIGIGLGQLLHAPISHAYGWQAAFLSGALPSALAGALLLVAWPAGGAGSARRMSLPSADECIQVVLAGLVWTFYTGGFIALLTYTPALLAARGQPAWVADVVMNATTWGNLPAVLFGGALAARFGDNRVFLVGMLAAMLSVALLPLGWPLFWGALYGTLGAMHGTVIVASGTLSARPEQRAVGMALFYSTYYLGSTVFPAICGRAADLSGDPGGALLCGAAISAFAFPCWWLHRARAARLRTRSVGAA